MTAWTTSSDIRMRVRRRWDDGSILRALSTAAVFPVVDVPLHGPRPAEIGNDLAAVRSWISALEGDSRSGARFTIRYAKVGGRVIGRNELPSRALVESYDQAAALLGVASEVRAFRTILSVVAVEPAISAWVSAHPLRALDYADRWPTVLSAHSWLRAARGSGRYLREIDARGVDTKFVEKNRPLLAQLLDVSPTASGFLTELGLRTRPETLRLRPRPSWQVTAGLTDVTARVDELAVLDIATETAVVIENEITYLSVPMPSEGVVLWGKGFEVDRVGSMPWLAGVEVFYWGDLDTHGFAILNRLRAWLPQTRSMLMDRETLLVHRDRWVTEISPATSRLDRLTADEQAVYQDLVTGRLGDRVRLEQERIDWDWVTERLAYRDASVDGGQSSTSGPSTTSFTKVLPWARISDSSPDSES